MPIQEAAMLYAERDEKGEVIAVRSVQTEPQQRQISTAELVAFLSQGDDRDAYLGLLNLLDSGVIRIVDDLIELLVKKNVILFTDLTVSAQDKLNKRKALRQKFQNNEQFSGDDVL